MESEPANRMKHITVDFFSYYLQEREDYTEYFSEDFIYQVYGLAWREYEQ